MIMTYLLTSSKAPILSCYRRQDTIFFLSSSIFLLLIFIIQQGRGMPRPYMGMTNFVLKMTGSAVGALFFKGHT